MKLNITEVTKYEYNGKLYDTKEEIQDVYEEEQISELYKKIDNTISYINIDVNNTEEILKVIAKIPDRVLSVLRKKMNKIEKESN